MSKPLEFWLCGVDFDVYRELDSNQTISAFLKNPSIDKPSSTAVKFIEYSAYQSLQAENEKLKGELEDANFLIKHLEETNYK